MMKWVKCVGVVDFVSRFLVILVKSLDFILEVLGSFEEG